MIWLLRMTALVMLLLLGACHDGAAAEEQSDPAEAPGSGNAPAGVATPAAPVDDPGTAGPPADHPLPKIKWKAKISDGSSNAVQVINPDCILSSRGSYAMQVFNSQGECVLTFPGERVPGREEAGLTFRPDGSYYRVTRHTENYQPDKPYIELAYHAPDGSQRWSKMLTNGWIQEGRIMVQPDGFLTIASASEKTGLNDWRRFQRITKFDLDGEVVRTTERDQQNHQDRFDYSLRPLADGTFRSGREGSIVAYDRALNELWTYTARGVRREFMLQDDGTAFALIKAPEQLIKVGADGKLAWSCNLSENAVGKLNSMFESGYAHGPYLTVAPDGTVYVCDAYSSLSAVSPAGEHLWSVQDPRRATGEGDQRLYSMDYPEAPAVGVDGTVYLKSDERNLMAVSAAGQVLWVDKRFADIWDPPAVSPDGTVYVSSGGWLYALDPQVAASTASLPEQEAIIEAERARHAEWEAEWAAEKAAMLAEVEAAGGDPDEYLEQMYGMGEPKIKPDPDGPYLADRTEVAGIIIEAMHTYYDRHGEYPPFLRGIKYEDDPLIKDGGLAAYPLMWPQPGCHCGEYGDWDGHVFSRWKCKTRAPEEYRGEADLQDMEEYRGGCDHHGSITAANYFGYTRGDQLEGSTREAWLWFYGSNIWPEQNNPVPEDGDDWKAEEYFDLFNDFYEFGDLGLDLLNSKTGALMPDGTPDGICLLYKLKDGELTEVIRAEGI